MTDEELVQTLTTELNIRHNALVSAQNDLDAANTQIDVLNAKIKEMEETWTPPGDGNPQPPTLKQLVGKSGPNNVPNSADRLFYNTGVLTKPQFVSGCPRTHVSHKISGPAPTEAQIIAAYKDAPNNTKAELWHECDVKFIQGDHDAGETPQQTLDKRLAMKTDFHRKVVKLRNEKAIPMITTVNTLSSARIADGTADRYVCEADVGGFDLDGGKSFKDYGAKSLLDGCQTHADKHYNGRWTAPEHGWNDVTTPAKVAQRMGYVKEQATKILAAGAEEYQYFDAKPSELLNAAERVEFKQLVDQYNS